MDLGRSVDEESSATIDCLIASCGSAYFLLPYIVLYIVALGRSVEILTAYVQLNVSKKASSV